MAVDYDLVIIGSSRAGIYAAKNAAQLQARVALVTHSDDQYLSNQSLVNHSLSEIGRFNYQLANNSFAWKSANQQSYVSLSEAGDWSKSVNSVMQSRDSLSGLAALGIDVIVGKGEFYRQPKLGFRINQRKLRSRNFLLAMDTGYISQWFVKHSFNGCLTVQDIVNRDLPERLIIIGNDPTTLELAQTLARFERQITLVVESSSILSLEDKDIAILIQAQLEAEGITILTNVKVSQIKTIEGQKWLQAGDIALSADEIIVVDRRQPNTLGLNLAGVDVKYDESRIYVNQKLQTTNPNIYACGDIIGGYCLPNITQYEVNLVLKNTLFLPWYKAKYNYLPWAVLTQPNLARVGLNETQARQHYPNSNLYVVKQYFDRVSQAQILDRSSGICKLMVKENGEILGCSLVSDRAAELISIIALMLKHKIKLDSNPMKGLTSLSIPVVYPSMAKILQQASHNFYRQKLQQNPQLLNRLKTWFSIRKA